MKIYTSYYGNLRKLGTTGILPIGISLGVPNFFKGHKMMYLAPTRAMLNSLIPQEEYTKMYREQILSKVSLDTLREDLSIITRGQNVDVALLCWEKPGDFCHRHLFAEWMKEMTGYEIEEFGVTNKKLHPPSKPKEIQQSLF